MKIDFTKWMLISVVILGGLYADNRMMAQATDGWKEMVAGLPADDHTAPEYLLPVIKAIPGVSYEGFCDSQRCLLLLFDPYLYAETGQLVDTFAAYKIRLFPKENTTFRMLLHDCALTDHSLNQLD